MNPPDSPKKSGYVVFGEQPLSYMASLRRDERKQSSQSISLLITPSSELNPRVDPAMVAGDGTRRSERG